jgi:hypothetical protein
MKDKLGFAFQEGCKVIRAVMSGKSPMLDICVVTKIDGDNLYLDGSKKAMNFPERLIIWEQDPLYRMVKEYDNNKQE